MCRARNISRAAGTGTGGVNRLVHGRKHLRMLAHAKVVVAAPDGDQRLAAFVVVICRRVASATTHNIGEDSVPALPPQPRERVAKSGNIGKRHFRLSDASLRAWASYPR